MWRKCFLIILALAFLVSALGPFVHAAPGSIGKTKSIKKRTSKSASQGFIPASPVLKSESNSEIKIKKPATPWGLGVSYQVNTDFNDRTKPRGYRNLISTNLSYGILGAGQIYVGVSAGYAGNENGEIEVDRETQQNFLSDVNLGYSHPISVGRESTMEVDVNNSFPTSPYTQQEGVLSITELGISGALPLVKRLSLIGAASAHYIWNTYEKSPTSLRLNKQAGSDLGAGLSIRLNDRWSLKGTGGVRAVRFVDGSGELRFQNAAALAFSQQRFSAELRYLNGSYADQEDVDLFLIDEYRRLTQLRLSYQF